MVGSENSRTKKKYLDWWAMTQGEGVGGAATLPGASFLF